MELQSVRTNLTSSCERAVKWKWIIVCLKTVTAISLSLFSSSQNPRYSTNEGTVLEGTMVDDVFKDLELGSDREVEVSMFFGCTSIQRSKPMV
jgi:hypothetical protein